MNIKDIFTDDEAVSPVIGVILMVAITVILAAVIGAFVLNLGGSQNAAPQASWSFNASESGSGSDTDDALWISHEGGDQVDLSVIEIQAGGSTVYDGDSGQIQGNFKDDPSSNSDSEWKSPVGEASAGSTLRVKEDSGSSQFASGDTVQIIWENPDSDDTNIIGESSVSY